MVISVSLGGIARWPYDWFVRRVRNRDDLRRRGSEAITPVMEFVAKLGPPAVSMGSKEQITAYLRALEGEWHDGLRKNLRVYANQHPLEEVRDLTAALIEAVGRSYAASSYFGSYGMNSAAPLDAYNETQQRHDEAVAAGEKLMVTVRAY